MSDKSYEEEVEGILLPQWLTDVLPEHLPWSVISFDEDVFKVSHDGSEFKYITEAYDYAASFKGEYQVVLDASVDGNGGELMNGFYFCDPEQGDNSSRLLISHTTQDSVAILKHDYLTWLTKVSLEYSLEPDSFFHAHRWLTYHPVFWRKSRMHNDFRWDTTVGLDDATVSVWWDEEKDRAGICLEAGSHREPTYTHYYRDDRLTSYGHTYEEVIIMLAKKVNTYFDVDGNERSQ